MSFCPKNQLQKHGWECGMGLGRNKQGIKEPVKVKLKFDSTGVGHDPGEQFSHHWWDVAFNSAAKNIQVKETEGRVEIKKTGESCISAKKIIGNKAVDPKSMLYGSFIKAATLTDGNEVIEHSSESESNTSESEEEHDTQHNVLTDEQLFKICGGRTAHKGARHGLKANGKLARIAQQEATVDSKKCGEQKLGSEINAGSGVTFDTTATNCQSKKRKKNKRSRNVEEDSISLQDTSRMGDENLCHTIKKKKKERHVNEECTNKNINKIISLGHRTIKSKQKKKKKKKDQRCKE